MSGRRSPIVEQLAQLLCLMSEEDTAMSIHGNLDNLPKRRHWATLAEFMRDGYRQDARRIVKFLSPKLATAPDLTEEL